MATKNIVQIALACAALSAVSCTSTDEAQVNNDVPAHFSLAHYFEQEAARLQQHSPTIAKTVSKDGETENRHTQITDWGNELALFVDSDINKAAWRGSYAVDSNATTVIYSSLDPALRTEKISIHRHGDGSIKHIEITNRTNNMLYQTTEQLDYYPDSLYRIAKQQRVRILGDSEYIITGVIQ